MRINGVHRNNEMTGINGPTGIFELITALENIKLIQKCLETEKFVCRVRLIHYYQVGTHAPV